MVKEKKLGSNLMFSCKVFLSSLLVQEKYRRNNKLFTSAVKGTFFAKEKKSHGPQNNCLLDPIETFLHLTFKHDITKLISFFLSTGGKLDKIH